MNDKSRIRTAATSKVWRDSGRASFSSSSLKKTKRGSTRRLCQSFVLHSVIAPSATLRAFSICRNSSLAPLPDQTVWKRNRLSFPRVFTEKPSPSRQYNVQDLTDLAEEFWIKGKLSMRRKWSGRSVLTNGKRPKNLPGDVRTKITGRWLAMILCICLIYQ